MWRECRRALASAAVTLIVTATSLNDARADAAPPELGRALDEVLAASPSMATATAELHAARARSAATAVPLYNPELSYERERAEVDTDAFGVALTLDWSGKQRARRNTAAAQQLAALASWRSGRQRLALAWLDAWLDLRNATAQLAIGAIRVEHFRQFAELAQRRFTLGDLGSAERDLALLAAQQARAQQARLTGGQARARAVLSGLSATLPEATLPTVVPGAIDSNADIDVARLPAVEEATAVVEAANRQIRGAQLQRRPDPTLSARTGRVDVGLARKENLFAVGISIPLPLFNTGTPDLLAARAEARVAAQRLTDQTLQARTHALLTRDTFNALRMGWIAIADGAIDSAQRLSLLERLWQSGELGSADYLVQIEQTLQTQQERTALLNDVWRAWFDWLAACGRFDDWFGLPAKPDRDSASFTGDSSP